jgi:Zn-finger nucleic acid-binding protein
MISLELDDVEIDRCFSCGGIWLDRGELELLLEGSAAREEFISSFRIDTETDEKPRRCPICDKRMEKVRCGGEKGVLIDRCKNGDGIWLDRGELREILEAASFGGDSRVLELLKEMLARERR